VRVPFLRRVKSDEHLAKGFLCQGCKALVALVRNLFAVHTPPHASVVKPLFLHMSRSGTGKGPDCLNVGVTPIHRTWETNKCAKARNEGVVDNVESTLDARVQTEDPIFMQITDKLLSPN
jgi:hypothetical protein